MPALTIELDDKGEFVGDIPAEIAAIITRAGAEQYKTGYGKGVQQAATEAKKQIEDAIAVEKARLAALDPLEKERVARIESDHAALTTRIGEMSKEFDRTLKGREEAHANEIVKRSEDIRKRNDRIMALTKKAIRVEAAAAGARDESLDELEIILGNFIGFDDDMNDFVKGPDGSPQLAAGKPVTLGAFVKQYLDAHAHHRKPKPGEGGNARRGASLSGNPSPTSVDAARQRIEGGDRSAAAINDLFEANRKRTA